MSESAWPVERVTLLPATKRLKQIIREHGAHGWVVMERRPVECFHGEIGVWITSPDAAHDRWVRPEHIKAGDIL